MITQAELRELLLLQRRLKRARDAAKDLKEKADVAEAVMLGRLRETMEPVERGRLLVSAENHPRRNVAWKAVVERELGEPYAERVLNETEPTDRWDVVIVERLARVARLRKGTKA